MYPHPSGRRGSNMRRVMDIVVLTTGVIVVEGRELIKASRHSADMREGSES